MHNLCVPCLDLCMILLPYDMETFTFSDPWNPGSVPLSIVCGCGPGAVRGQGANDGTMVVFCSVSGWLRGQPPPKLLHSIPQCCSHCLRSRQPTHSLTSSPHFNRKFISSTYGLEGTHMHNQVMIYSKQQDSLKAVRYWKPRASLTESWKTCWMLADVPASPWRKHQMELDQASHGVHVILKRQAESVFGVALSLEGVHHLSHGGAPSAHAAEPLPQSQRHAPQSVLHKRLTLGGEERGGGSSAGAPGARSETCGTSVRAGTSANVSIQAGHTLDLHNPLMHICSSETDRLFPLPVL